jgi:hypothetical protein
MSVDLLVSKPHHHRLPEATPRSQQEKTRLHPVESQQCLPSRAMIA